MIVFALRYEAEGLGLAISRAAITADIRIEDPRTFGDNGSIATEEQVRGLGMTDVPDLPHCKSNHYDLLDVIGTTEFVVENATNYQEKIKQGYSWKDEAEARAIRGEIVQGLVRIVTLLIHYPTNHSNYQQWNFDAPPPPGWVSYHVPFGQKSSVDNFINTPGYLEYVNDDDSDDQPLSNDKNLTSRVSKWTTPTLPTITSIPTVHVYSAHISRPESVASSVTESLPELVTVSSDGIDELSVNEGTHRLEESATDNNDNQALSRLQNILEAISGSESKNESSASLPDDLEDGLVLVYPKPSPAPMSYAREPGTPLAEGSIVYHHCIDPRLVTVSDQSLPVMSPLALRSIEDLVANEFLAKARDEKENKRPIGEGAKGDVVRPRKKARVLTGFAKRAGTPASNNESIDSDEEDVNRSGSKAMTTPLRSVYAKQLMTEIFGED